MEGSQPVRHNYDYYPVSMGEKIKRLPWVDIGFIVTAVALATIGALAHFHVLHHVGQLNRSTIEYVAYAAAGGAIFQEMLYRYWKNQDKKPSEEISFNNLRSFETSGYDVQGKFPEKMKKHIERLLAKESFMGWDIDQIFMAYIATGDITITKGDFKFEASYDEGWRVYFSQEDPPLTIRGSIVKNVSKEDMKAIARIVTEKDPNEVESALITHFEKNPYAIGTLSITFMRGDTPEKIEYTI